jgi:hypothetical protein
MHGIEAHTNMSAATHISLVFDLALPSPANVLASELTMQLQYYFSTADIFVALKPNIDFWFKQAGVDVTAEPYDYDFLVT